MAKKLHDKCYLTKRKSVYESLSDLSQSFFKKSSMAHLGPCLTSLVELFCENSEQLKAVYYFCKKVP